MATSDKEQQSKLVPQRTRIAAGAWNDGEKYEEQGKATMPKANVDHGDFTKSAIKKDNA